MSVGTKSLKALGNKELSGSKQLAKIKFSNSDTFKSKLLAINAFPLMPNQVEIFQMNLGKMCNQVCDHCHVDAGPDRKEIMTKSTMQACLVAIDKTPSVTAIDLTGGAPEMNPDFEWLLTELYKRKKEVIVRSNLTILLANEKYKKYPQLFKDLKVHIIASLPCYTEQNVDKQRGNGVFKKSIEAIQLLNQLGYGEKASGLLLDFVYNPGGPGIPGDQKALEQDYKRILWEEHGIIFNHLYTITNMPISRFLHALEVQGRVEEYMTKLINAFNPASISGLMCKNTLSVSWDGQLYDCDFNQMLELPINIPTPSIHQWNPASDVKRKIVVNEHCFGCTAGAGSSCQGALV